MPPGMTQGTYFPVVVEKGRVLDVDPKRWALTIGSFFTNKVGIIDVPMLCHYLGFDGEGIYVMPEIGTVIYTCSPSDSVQPFVLGWVPPGEAPEPNEATDDGAATPRTFVSNRPPANPGDIVLRGKDGNFIYVRRGGLVQIGANALAQRVYIPVDNIIRDIAQSYDLITLPGELKWELDSPQDHTDGKAPGRFHLAAKKYASDEKPIAELIIGEHRGENTHLSLKVWGESGGDVKAELTIDATGGITCRLAGPYSLSCSSWAVNSESTANLTAKTSAKVVAPSLTLQPRDGGASGFRFSGDSSTETWLSKTIDAPSVTLGRGAVPYQAVRGQALIAWLATAVIVAAPGPPGSYVFNPASLAALGEILSPTVKVT